MVNQERGNGFTLRLKDIRFFSNNIDIHLNHHLERKTFYFQ